MIRFTTFAAILFFVSFGSNADEPLEHIESYLEAFNAKTSIENIAKHWHDQVTILSAQGVKSFGSNGEFAEWMGNMYEQLVSKGWVRSEMLESAVCELTDTTAIVSIKFARKFKDGNRIEGSSFYILAKTDGWKIVGASLNKPGVLVGCRDSA